MFLNKLRSKIHFEMACAGVVQVRDPICPNLVVPKAKLKAYGIGGWSSYLGGSITSEGVEHMRTKLRGVKFI